MKAQTVVVIISFASMLTSCVFKSSPVQSATAVPSQKKNTIESFTAGRSVQARPIEATRIGAGKEKALVIIGGIHGEEKNTSELAERLSEAYETNPEKVPRSVTLFILPLANPDGRAAGMRENANKVDINRNFPVRDWRANALDMHSVMVDGLGGTAPGSEPETMAIVSLLMNIVKPNFAHVCVIALHSASPPVGYVQPGYFENGVADPASLELADLAHRASGYKLLPAWKEKLPITGELIRFCAENGIRAMDLELPTYDPPDVVPKGKLESTFESAIKLVDALLE